MECNFNYELMQGIQPSSKMALMKVDIAQCDINGNMHKWNIKFITSMDMEINQSENDPELSLINDHACG